MSRRRSCSSVVNSEVGRATSEAFDCLADYARPEADAMLRGHILDVVLNPLR